MIKPLLLSGLRYFKKHPSQLLISILGVALGVALIVSVDVSNQSSSRAFDLSVENILGKTTHHIIGSPQGIDDNIYIDLRVKHRIKNITPVIESYATTTDEIGKTFTLFGIDPFTEAPFRPVFHNIAREIAGEASTFLTVPNGVFISENAMLELSLEIGDTLGVRLGGLLDSVVVVGMFKSEDETASGLLDNIMVCDISSAQSMLKMPGQISRIDAIIDDNILDYAELDKLLPEGLQLINANSKSSAVQQMASAFKMNLSSMSLLALIVGMFLIYNTITFSVVQRRRLIGLFRTLGVTRREIFRIVIIEALIVGIIGTAIGLVLGAVIARELIGLVTVSINDLYYHLSVNNLEIENSSILKAAIAGITATIISALHPAYEATRSMTVNTLRRSDLEKRHIKAVPYLAVFSVLSIGLSFLLFSIDLRNIYFSFLSIVPMIVGFTLLTPIAIMLYVRFATPMITKLFGTQGAISVRSLKRNMSRTTIAVAALAIAVSASIGVATMVGSFRTTVVYWLETRLQADAYVSAPSLISRKNQSVMEPEIADILRKLPEAGQLNVYREIDIFYNDKYHTVLAGDRNRESDGTFTFKKGDNATAWNILKNENAVLISEPYEYHNKVTIGDSLTLPTVYGDVTFEIIGVYYDYSSDMGLVTMDLDRYRYYFEDNYISGISIYAAEGVSTDSLLGAIRAAIPAEYDLIAQSNRNLLDRSIEVFDRTFIITYVLQILAIAVAFIGILSSFMALQLEKSKEFSVMRALGLTGSELKQQILLQTSQMGLLAGLLSLPLGNALALVLTHVINKRSFGWTLQFEFSWDVMLQAVILSIIAAVLAAIYPAYKIASTNPSMAMREE